ncbi:MAG: hypothetical protein F6K16_00670 [Symploca sp. SIO2B6]|nr:hypothetical protein [Symploca sp. SIO2B6]
MLIARAHRFLTAPSTKYRNPQLIFWFSLSLTFAAIYGLLALREAFSSEYVVQDDARQHVFWMARYLQPQLFPNNLIANYFQSVAPLGYTSFYQLLAAVGMEPIILSKLLPIALGLVTTAYCFGVCLEILPVPAAGFIASMLLNQSLLMKPELVSATPRAFLYPLFLGFLYYLLQRKLFPCMLAIALLAMFYPQCALVGVGILVLRLFQWQGGGLRFSQNRRNYLFCAAGVGVVLLILLPYALGSSEFGPVISATQAKALPEFWRKGRGNFFNNDPWYFFMIGRRSGLLPQGHLPITILIASFLLPILLKFPSRFPVLRLLTDDIKLLPQIFLASVGLFIASHLLIFRLHLPSRYTGHSLRIITALAAAIVIIVLVDAAFRWSKRQTKYVLGRQLLVVGLTGLLGIVFAVYPHSLKKFPNYGYVVGGMPTLYKFFAKQPQDILIASLSPEVDNLPVFSQRSILVGWEYAIPYHLGYYNQIKQRATDLIKAQYTQELTELKSFIQMYGVDFILLDRAAFSPEYLQQNPWFKQWRTIANEILSDLEQGNNLALSSIQESCSDFEVASLIVLNTECILSSSDQK